MRPIKRARVAMGLGVCVGVCAGVCVLGTVAVAQKAGGGGGSTPVAPPPVKNIPSGNNPNYNSNYNLPTNNVYAPYGYPYGGLDIYAINASSAVAQQQRLKIAEQYRKLNSDMDKLMDLTKQLKMRVDSQTDGQISADLVKKTGEIEKLAKNIQTQQKN